jgi:hypothetical protein
MLRFKGPGRREAIRQLGEGELAPCSNWIMSLSLSFPIPKGAGKFSLHGARIGGWQLWPGM